MGSKLCPPQRSPKRDTQTKHKVMKTISHQEIWVTTCRTEKKPLHNSFQDDIGSINHPVLTCPVSPLTALCMPLISRSWKPPDQRECALVQFCPYVAYCAANLCSVCLLITSINYKGAQGGYTHSKVHQSSP